VRGKASVGKRRLGGRSRALLEQLRRRGPRGKGLLPGEGEGLIKTIKKRTLKHEPIKSVPSEE